MGKKKDREAARLHPPIRVSAEQYDLDDHPDFMNQVQTDLEQAVAEDLTNRLEAAFLGDADSITDAPAPFDYAAWGVERERIVGELLNAQEVRDTLYTALTTATETFQRLRKQLQEHDGHITGFVADQWWQ